MYFPDKKLAENIVKKYGTPVFVTDKNSVVDRVKELRQNNLERLKIYYAIKANYNPAIIKSLKAAGIDGIDAVSPFEIEMARSCGFDSNHIIFTGNNSDDNELKEVHFHKIIPNLGSISELERFGKIFSGSEVSVRFNPGVGAGESKHVVTGGKKSKFGISHKDIKSVQEVLKKYQLKLIGVHCHIGSGFYKARVFRKSVKSILSIASYFNNLRFIDLGGGFGVRYGPKSKDINIPEFFSAIEKDIKRFEEENGNEIDVIIEPGKFLVAESTCMLTKVTNIKKSGGTVFVGTDTGMNHIIRPAMYSAYHHVINISNPQGKSQKVKIVGNICESSDVFCEKISIASPKEGDILAILSVGAYCASMSSLYNLRPYASEVLVDKGSTVQIRKRMSFDDAISGLGFV
ncbi:MAG: diaminopimelate decarboxylase [Alphaproteobacteria bacterium]|nr:diaminopimelate decarboxylase [Alphaproteobacteria bacterium]